ncbi:MAG: methyl-accepting chemotaxis protein [Defluviitaleaceae bacterium]|nr:methyl-accepting chemotaxis protein [Defluviitaleaceae bacterium]MCL2239852.1 methyl-accepting chemotaxis protein [Defluviitaleaceae bacterium]
MFKSLKSKLTIPSIGIIVLVVLGIMLYSSNAASTLADNLIWERAYASSRAADAHIAQLSAQTNVVAYAVAGDYTILSAIMDWNAGNNRTENRNIIINRLRELGRTMAVDSFTVRDFEGRTIVRLHDLNFYYDIDGLANAVNAIEHRQSTTSFTSTAAMPMSLITTVPIIHEDQVLGTMAPIFHFNTDQFINNISHVFNAPVSVYRGRETVASSLMLEGRPAVGVEVSEEIGDIVIDERTSHMVDHYIDGEGAISFYMPFLGAAGNAIGMMAIHFSTADADDATSSMVMTMLLFGIIGVLAAAGIMFLLIRRSLKPLDTLSRTVKDVAGGNINVNINRANLPKDEIGALTQDVCALVDIIKHIVTDLTNTYSEYMEKGNIYHAMNESEYQNSFKEVIKLVNKLLAKNTKDIISIGDTLNALSNGEFKLNMTIDDWPGEWKVIPQTLINLTDNLNSVSTEIGAMINAISAKGDLSFQIEADKYSNDWREIMTGLNHIGAAVEAPIKSLEIAMGEMKEGNFTLTDIDSKITQAGYDANAENYNGVFKGIMLSFESTITAISSYIGDITDNLALISAGNLTTEITRAYAGDFEKIKESLNSISATLHKTMSDISIASEQVLSGAKQISTSAQELANGAQEQASSVEELNATIDVLNQQTKQNADNASEASELSKLSTTNAQEGNASMRDMLTAMTQIKESSGEIAKIIKAIQDIAFQTNLLALNASVEAARAGEHGRGFSVVAEEVRNLAGRSQESVNETTGLIETSNNRVESGSSIAEATAKALDAIVKNATEVSEIIKSISVSSAEQAEAISQVSTGLSQISQVVQSNSAVSEEAAAASEELNAQAEMLQQLVAYFKL